MIGTELNGFREKYHLRRRVGGVCHPKPYEHRAVVRQFASRRVFWPVKLPAEGIGHQSARHPTAQQDVIDVTAEGLRGHAVLKCLSLGGIDEVGFRWVTIIDLAPDGHAGRFSPQVAVEIAEHGKRVMPCRLGVDPLLEEGYLPLQFLAAGLD